MTNNVNLKINRYICGKGLSMRRRAILIIMLLNVMFVALASSNITREMYLPSQNVVAEFMEVESYGGLFGESASYQNYKYSSKELETMNGLNTYDFHARPYYYPAIIFHSPDILSEEKPWLSPYLYCAGNPVMFIDPTGMESWWSQIWNDPEIMARIEVAIKAAGGITEAVVGATAGVATSWTGVGAVLGGAALVHGCDVAASGISQMISGEETSSLTSQGLQAAGVHKETAEMIDGGISIGLTGSAGMIKTGISATPKTAATSVSVDEVTTQLNNIAKDAATVVGPGSGAVHGTKVHTAFRNRIKGLKINGYIIRTEETELNGRPFNYGTKGSARLDATVYDSNGNLVRAYDLKTGNAKLTQKQINHIQTHTNSKIPVIVIRP